MRGSASTPALAVLDDARQAARQRATASLNRSQSLTASSVPTTAAAHYTSLVHATPFFALPGVSTLVTNFTRSYSRAANLFQGNQGNTSYGSLGMPTSFARLSSTSHQRMDSATSSASFTPSAPSTPGSMLSFSFDLANTDEDELIPDHQLNPPLTSPLLLAVTCAVLSSFQNGFNSALLNVPEPVIRHSLNLSDTDWSLVVSIFCIGGLVGCSVGGYLSDRQGRKNFLVTNNVLFIVGALLQALATSVWMMIVGRFLIGVACGGCTVVVPLYLGEIAPANLRGSLGTMNQFATVIGILVAVVMGRPMGTAEEWRYLIGLVLLPSMLQIVMSASLLESPLWLVLTGGSKGLSQAEEILCALRGMGNVEFDLDAMVYHRDMTLEQTKSTSSTTMATLASLTKPSNRRPLLTGMALQVSQQLSGINAVFFYSTAFFMRAKVEDPWLGSVLCCAVNVVATWWALSIMDRVGRKTLLLISATGMALSALALTYFLTAQASADTATLTSLSTDTSTPPPHSPDSSSPFLSPQLSSYLSILFVLLYVTFFELGLGPIPWTIGVEIYPSAIRGPAMSLSSTVNWLSNFLVSIAFPHLSSRLGGCAFLPFVGALVLTVVGVLVAVPETRGKTVEQIMEEMGVEDGECDEDHSMGPNSIDEEEEVETPRGKSHRYHHLEGRD